MDYAILTKETDRTFSLKNIKMTETIIPETIVIAIEYRNQKGCLMETLKYAILGLLMKKDMTGYELTKEFNSALFEFWNASHSQIYPKLKALTKEGLIEYHIEITGTVLEKKVYTITENGKKAFKKWEETLYPMPSLPKDEFRLQLFFSHLASPEFRIQLLHDQLSQHLDRLQYLKEDMEKFTTTPPADDELFTDYLVLSGGIAREEAMCDWLKECIRLCKNRP